MRLSPRAVPRALPLSALAGALSLGLMAAPGAHASASGVVISEFRVGGTAGGSDEFVELVNGSTASVDVSGWKLRACASGSGALSDRTTIPAGTTLPAGGRYLFANSSGYSGGVAADRTYTTGIANSGKSGLRLTTASGATVDGAGTTSSPCREGTGVSLSPVSTNGDSYHRAGTAQATDTDSNAADLTVAAPAPQNAAGAGGGGTGGGYPIHSIQGSGTTSPVSGSTRTIEGVVTGIDDEVGASFGSGNSINTYPEDAGIFVQEEPADYDADANTSEGIFVGYVDGSAVGGRANLLGKRVRVTGVVKEKFGQTILSESNGQEPVVIDTAIPAHVPAAVTLDAADANAQTPAGDGTRAYYERTEGMKVTLPTGVAGSGGTNKFGELFLTPGTTLSRVFRTDTAGGLIAIDDDAGSGDPANPYRPQDSGDPEFSTTEVAANLFDTVTSTTGPMSFNYGNYRIVAQPGAVPAVTAGPTPVPYTLPAPATDEFRVASFNVENLFPDGGLLDGGTVTAAEFSAHLDDLAAAINDRLQRPEVIAVQEVGDLRTTGGTLQADSQATLDALAARLTGYTAYAVEGNDDRGIDVGYLVKSGVTVHSVTQVGKTAQGECSDVQDRLFDRPPLVLDVSPSPTRRFTVINNHFASKSAPDSCRSAQADYVKGQVDDLVAAGKQVLVTGDLNAFETESGVTNLTADGTLTNLWSTAPAADRYSFAFQGKLQTLDHALVTSGLQGAVRAFRYAHFDTDYTAQIAGHRVSDHDPPVLTIAR